MTYILHRVKVETGAGQKMTSERNFKNSTNTFPLKSHINNLCTTNVLTKNLKLPGIKGLDLMRFIIYGSSSTFFRLVCIILASEGQKSKC